MKESASEKERESQDAFSLREHNLTRNVNCVGVRECVVLVGFLRGKEKNTSGGGDPYLFCEDCELKSAGSVRMQWPDFVRRALVLSDPFEQVVTNQIKAASR